MKIAAVLILAALTIGPSTLAQESICDPCVDGPEIMRGVRRDDFLSREATTVVTAAEMRSLGVLTIGEMINGRDQRAADCSRTEIANGPSFRHPGSANDWFGTNSFGVLLLPDGRYQVGGYKIFWYVPGLAPDQVYDIDVEIRRIDTGANTAEISDPTNAFFDDRWHILTGMNFPDPGCWEITGSYRGRELSFVIESVQ